MFRWLRSILCLGLLFSCGLAAQAKYPYNSVCIVDHGSWTGTGTIIAVQGNYAYILSARHVGRREGDFVKLTWPWGVKQTREGRVLEIVDGKGWGSDLCIIKCWKPLGLQPVEYQSYNAVESEWFVTIGYRGGNLFVSKAQKCVQSKDYPGALVLDSGVYGGMSGGPAFNKYGKLVGVVVAGPAAGPNDFTVLADGENLKRLIDKYTE